MISKETRRGLVIHTVSSQVQGLEMILNIHPVAALCSILELGMDMGLALKNAPESTTLEQALDIMVAYILNLNKKMPDQGLSQDSPLTKTVTEQATVQSTLTGVKES